MPMKKLLFSALLAGASYAASAQVVAPGGADLPARIASLAGHSIEVEVVKPKTVNTVWDELAANMAGCRITGTRAPSPGARMSLSFGTLACAGKPPVAIEAIGVVSVNRRDDLDSRATVGAPLAVLVLANIYQPGGKAWDRAVR